MRNPPLHLFFVSKNTYKDVDDGKEIRYQQLLIIISPSSLLIDINHAPIYLPPIGRCAYS